ncbi:MAG TPA: peptide MFS transporter [Candidatus Saccharicenans sp.]|jgi:POT family proton-dependent oligopeptide transporter|nr:peptide MFS transporter [Candidatus Saccharicenans sp.]HPC88294.1 peptide MFS transporter [Candidatus Saccharicenans sp.]HPP23456.1 peptide MFS transporter [Candidatus Saccharicenans sp.]HRT25942.1 peptide MFS transporter [Candidatus Saccharicenans sp.]HRV06255.1 peptide MFS transporter [Candidatus Saccharicenans sp.]
MFKGHPKGLIVAFFANMGERFGFYTMVSIFVLFMQAKYGLSSATAGTIYGIFMFCVYFFPLLGGYLADRVFGYGKTISLGLIVMFLGYLLLAIPTRFETGFGLVLTALGVIALGTGLFKGNLQALVGNLYDDPKYSALRDRAFNIFYMGINIGAMFAPSASEKVCSWILAKGNFVYDARIPQLANDFLKGKLSDVNQFLDVARAQNPAITIDSLRQFAESYLGTLSKSYHFGFGVACLSLIVSMLIFWGFRKYYRQADVTEKQKAASAELKSQVVELTPEQTKERLVALGLVFFVVIFFWMAFQQSAVSMTFFARDYTVSHVDKLTNIWFDLTALIPLYLSLVGLYYLLRKGTSSRTRLAGGLAFVVFAVLTYLRYRTYPEINPFQPQRFQHFNPFFIVSLTPLVIAYFAYLNKKGKEPSAPKKIGYGMILTAAAFTILVIGSIGLPSPAQLGGQVAPPQHQVSVYWLISTYFLLTIAELFLSPMGISFVSRVAPPKYKGLMQGGWFAATAIGNYLVGVVGWLWMKLPLWALWSILVVACLLSATFMFSIMKKLEKVATD